MPVPPQVPILTFFSPNKADQGLIELHNTSVSEYKPFDLGAPHPNTRDYARFKLGRQFNLPTDEKWVVRVWVTDETSPDWYNYHEKYLLESKAHPIFIRAYRVLKDSYGNTPVEEGSALTSVYKLVLTNPGSGYIPGTFPALTFSASTDGDATGHAVVKQDGTIAEFVLDYGGTGYESAPTFTCAAPTSGVTATGLAFIQPVSAILVAEEAAPYPSDSEFFGLYLNVTRVYKTLPGPPMVTRSIGQDNLTPEMYRRLVKRIETTKEVNFQEYEFPGGLVGNQTQIILQQKTFIEAELKVIEEVISITSDKIRGGDTGEWGVIKVERSVVNEGDAVDEGFPVLKSTITPFGNGKGAKVTARMDLGDFIVSAGVDSGGSGYVTAPTVGFTGGGGSGAAGTARILAGVVVGITITSKGSGYTSTPTIALTGGSGAGATATAYRGIAIVTEQDYDKGRDLHFTRLRYLAPSGTTINSPKRDVKALDIWRDEVVESGGNITVLDSFLWSMAGTTNIDMPDRLVGVQTFAESASGGGHSSASAQSSSTGGSVFASAQAAGQSSGAASVEVAPQIRQFYGSEIPCMFHHVYMPQGSSYEDVRTHLNALLGETVNRKPNFNPEMVQLVTVSRRFASRSNSSRSEGRSVTRNNQGQVTGSGQSHGAGGGSGGEVAQTVRKTTVSPTIHEILPISAEITAVVPGVGIDPGAGGSATASYLSGTIPGTVGDQTWPSTGKYLWHIRSSVFKEGYVLYQCLVIDASLFPNAVEEDTSGFYHYWPLLTGLTGGGSLNLDGKNMADYPIGSIHELSVDGRGSSQWKKKAWDNDARFGGATPVTDADGGIIKPPDWHGTTMNYVLERQRGF